MIVYEASQLDLLVCRIEARVKTSLFGREKFALVLLIKLISLRARLLLVKFGFLAALRQRISVEIALLGRRLNTLLY